MSGAVRNSDEWRDQCPAGKVPRGMCESESDVHNSKRFGLWNKVCVGLCIVFVRSCGDRQVIHFTSFTTYGTGRVIVGLAADACVPVSKAKCLSKGRPPIVELTRSTRHVVGLKPTPSRHHCTHKGFVYFPPLVERSRIHTRWRPRIAFVLGKGARTLNEARAAPSTVPWLDNWMTGLAH